MMDVAIIIVNWNGKVIIVNWNGKDLLRRCLNAVRETVQEVSYETYVVDNHSSDGSQEVVRNEYPWVKLMPIQRTWVLPKPITRPCASRWNSPAMCCCSTPMPL